MIDLTQIKADMLAHEAEGRDMSERKLLVAEIERLRAALQDIRDCGFNGRIHPADRMREMVQMAQVALDAAGEI